MLRSPTPARRLFLASLVSATAALSLAGCVSEKGTVTEPSAICTKVGDPCTFSPGKLGLCIESATDGTKLICQSQH
ncbi:MAG TPA: hypothetical protein VH044_10975 [Polyangiaceae bacterium]|jgi:hypothetical protein|nr:hypothetical protein [Polyangiaceae bacterium]